MESNHKEESLFTPEGLLAYEGRIEALSPDSKPLWGKMNVAQMLAHCQLPLEIALGDETAKMAFVDRFTGPIKKLYYTGNKKRFPQNIRTIPYFQINEYEDLDFSTEQTRLLVFLRRFSEKGFEGKLERRHPMYGGMSPRDWDLTQQKHLDHHLRQFGV